MKRKWKRALLASALALLALGAGSQLLLSHLLHGSWLPRKVQEKLSDILEAPVRVHRLSGSIWGSIRADGLEIDSSQADTGRFLEMDRALIDFSWWRLFRGDLGSVTLVQPRLTLIRNAEGEWNLPPRFLKREEGSASQGISLPEVGIQQGRVALIIPGATLELEDIRFSLRHLPPSKGILRYRVNLEARIPSLKAPLKVRGEIEQENAQFKADGSLAVSDVSLPELNDLLNRHPTFPFSIASGEAEIRSSFQYAQDEVQCSMEMDLADLEIQSATRNFKPDTIHVTGKCQVPKDRSVHIDQARIDVPALGGIDLRGTIPSDPAKSFSLQTEWKSAALERMTDSLRDWISLPVTPEGTLDLTIDATGTLSSEAAFNLLGEWKDFQLTKAGNPLLPVIPSIQIAGRGRILPGTQTIEIPEIEIASDNLFSASANIIVVSATEGIRVNGWSSAFIPDLSRAIHLSERYLPPGQIESASGQIRFETPFQLSGPAFDATPSIRLQITEARSAWGSLRGLNLSALGTLQNRALLTGRIEAELDALLSNSDASYRAEGLAIEQTLQNRGPQGYYADMEIKIEKASIPSSTAFQIPLQDISIQAHLSSSPTLKVWSLDAERIAAKGLPNCSLSVVLSLDENPSASVRFHTETLDGADLYSSWESSLPPPWQGWMAEGKGSFGLSADWHGQPAESTFMSSATGEIAGLNFFSADASKAGSNLNANFSLSAAAVFPEPFPLTPVSLSRLKDLKNVDWKARIGFQGDEFLLDTLYQEIKGIDFSISSQGRYFPSLDRIDSSSAIIALHPLGEFSISGSASGLSSTPEADVAVQATGINLEEIHGRFIRDGALKDYLPSLSGIAPTGIVDASVAFEGDRTNWRTQGLLELDQCDLQWPCSFPVDASGIVLQMPFRLASRMDRSESSQEDFPAAHLKYRGIAAGPLVFGPAEMSFVLADNDFHVFCPVSLPLAGGILSIHEMEIEDILAAQPHVVVHADAMDIQMESVTRNLALGAVPGVLSANLPRLETLEGDLISDGPAVLKVFDGEVQVSGLQVADYASSGKKIQFSAELKDINLLPLTSVLQYGQASGIIQGSIRDFSWGPGGLESFDVAIESVSRRGAPQEISVDLIEVITESGRGLGPAERAILRRSDLYKYNRLGLAAQLKDDRLTIRGTIPRKEAPLFMEGSTFGGINIALYPPPHGIAFEQYIEYLKRRIKQIKSSGGPRIE